MSRCAADRSVNATACQLGTAAAIIAIPELNRKDAEKIWRNTGPMVKVNVQPDCGNAPKKIFLRDFMIAFANNDVSFILDSLADDAVWDVVGETTVNGK